MNHSHSLQLHVSRYLPNSAMAAHRHDEAWLCLVLGGSYQEQIHARQQEHGPGDLLFCPAHAVHQQRFGVTGAVKILFSPSPQSQEYLLERGVALDCAPSLRGSPQLLQIGTRLACELSVDDIFAPLAAEGLALELLAALGRGEERTLAAQPPPWLRRLRECIDEGPAVAWSLDDLARQAGRHPVHVARSFRTWYGCTMGEYVRRMRAEKAALLLRFTRRPLLDIAFECGFAGAAQFSRSFKAALDMTPSAYRQAMR
ncbi:helix-turn-helix transcriptional regulator [Dyella tabacisoli]|uniref:AraC family transcriptional regulator n=1 Tax=Dyella tabacisoli TaxID=2282381 RepID=A0A369UJQ0_9GAMM|nr:helix-turn-helix domain-containing protein [Dyella tabacisoli]RDD80345.1 AraC family transcriptional regulator [Dyella tabacisoli]